MGSAVEKGGLDFWLKSPSHAALLGGGEKAFLRSRGRKESGGSDHLPVEKGKEGREGW